MRKNLRTLIGFLSIFAAAAATAQTLPGYTADGTAQSSDRRGRPGEFFNRHSISQWRADYVLAKARPAPEAGVSCPNTAYVAFMKVLPARNFLFESMPTTGGDYDRRAGGIQTYSIDHSDPEATFVFACWPDAADFGDFDKAGSIWSIAATSRLRTCEFAKGRPGKAICY